MHFSHLADTNWEGKASVQSQKRFKQYFPFSEIIIFPGFFISFLKISLYFSVCCLEKHNGFFYLFAYFLINMQAFGMLVYNWWQQMPLLGNNL